MKLQLEFLLRDTTEIWNKIVVIHIKDTTEIFWLAIQIKIKIKSVNFNHHQLNFNFLIFIHVFDQLWLIHQTLHSPSLYSTFLSSWDECLVDLTEEVEFCLAYLLVFPNNKLHPELLSFLCKAKCINPQSLVNTFRGSEKPIMSKMIQVIRKEEFMDRHKGSLAMLHSFSRESELDCSTKIKQFSFAQWKSIRKEKSYDVDFITRDALDFVEIREGILESTFDLAMERIDSIWATIMTKSGNKSIQSHLISVPSSKTSKSQASSTCTIVEKLKRSFQPMREPGKSTHHPWQGMQHQSQR